MSLQCTTPGLFEEWPETQRLDIDSDEVYSDDDHEDCQEEIKKNHTLSMENFISINKQL